MLKTVERVPDDGFNRVDAHLRSLDARIDGLQRTVIQIGGATIVAFLATLASVLATRA
jgi:hypothetical protein